MAKEKSVLVDKDLADKEAVAEIDVEVAAVPLAIPVDHPAYDTLKLLTEELAVSKREVDAGVVRIERKTTVRTEPVDLELRRTSAVVDRVPIDQPVDEIPKIRQDGEVIIVPVVEETVEVIRRLILKEEVHIRLEESTERYHDDVEVRRQDVEVSQLPTESDDNGKVLADG